MESVLEKKRKAAVGRIYRKGRVLSLVWASRLAVV